MSNLKQELIANFKDITGESLERSTFFIEGSSCNLQYALDTYFQITNSNHTTGINSQTQNQMRDNRLSTLGLTNLNTTTQSRNLEQINRQNNIIKNMGFLLFEFR